MAVMNTDAILWYNVGQFGQLGYAVPNWSDDVGSLNPGILSFMSLVGQNLFGIMHHHDVDLKQPPSANTVWRVHKLYKRASQILAARAVPEHELDMETGHNMPVGEIFKVYPIPYFKMNNQLMKQWAEYILMMLAHVMQHTENRKPMEISVIFAGEVGQYLTRVYRSLATELFGKTREQVRVPGFILSDEELGSYKPSDWFTSVEYKEPVPHLGHVFTEDRLKILGQGIPVTSLPSLQPWPANLTSYYKKHVGFRDAGSDAIEIEDETTDAQPSPGGGPVMPPPPGP